LNKKLTRIKHKRRCAKEGKKGGEITPLLPDIPNVPQPLIRNLIRKWLGAVLTAGKKIPLYQLHSHNRSHKGDNCLGKCPAP